MSHKFPTKFDIQTFLCYKQYVENTPSIEVLSKKELALENANPTSGLSKKELALETAGATRKVAYDTMVKALEAESMTVDKFGEEHFTPDHTNRLKAAELISKLQGDLKSVEEGIGRVVNISISVESLEPLLHMVKDVAQQLRALKGSGQQTGEVITDAEYTAVAG